MIQQVIGKYRTFRKYDNYYFSVNPYGQWSQIFVTSKATDKKGNVTVTTMSNLSIKVKEENIIAIPSYIIDTVSTAKKDISTYQLGKTIFRAYDSHRIIESRTQFTYLNNLGQESKTNVSAYSLKINNYKVYIPSFLNLTIEQVIILNNYLKEEYTEDLAKSIVRELHNIYTYAQDEQLVTEMYQYADTDGKYFHNIIYSSNNEEKNYSITNKFYTVERKGDDMVYLINISNGKLLLVAKQYNLFDILYTNNNIPKIVKNYVGNIEDILSNTEEYITDMLNDNLETVIFDDAENKFGIYSYSEGQLYSDIEQYSLEGLSFEDHFALWSLVLSGNNSRINNKLDTCYFEDEEENIFEQLLDSEEYKGIQVEIVDYKENEIDRQYILLEIGDNDIAIFENLRAEININGAHTEEILINEDILDTYIDMMKNV